jgi:predicted component of type VI protein secretion system
MSWGRIDAEDGSLLRGTELFGQEIWFGRRSAVCTIQLTHAAISGQHCFFSRRDDGTIWCEDRSLNGTIVDDRQLKRGESHIVKDGTRIVLPSEPPVAFRLTLFSAKQTSTPSSQTSQPPSSQPSQTAHEEEKEKEESKAATPTETEEKAAAPIEAPIEDIPTAVKDVQTLLEQYDDLPEAWRAALDHLVNVAGSRKRKRVAAEDDDDIW